MLPPADDPRAPLLGGFVPADSQGAGMNWREAAACRYEDPELFFPLGEDGLSLRQIEQARAVCHRCPVMRACGAWAVRNGESDGVWGAMTPAERRSLRRRRSTGSGS